MTLEELNARHKESLDRCRSLRLLEVEAGGRKDWVKRDHYHLMRKQEEERAGRLYRKIIGLRPAILDMRRPWSTKAKAGR